MKVTEKTSFVRLTPIYIILGLLSLVFSLLQRQTGYGDYTSTVLYFSVPFVIVGALFQIYTVLQSVSFRLEELTYLHLFLFLLAFFLYVTDGGFEIPYFASSLLFGLILLINTGKYSGQVQLFFLVGSFFYILASLLIFIGEGNAFLIKHTLAVGFLLLVSFGGIYLLLPMLQLERLWLSNYLWLHLALHTLFTLDLLIAWRGLDFTHLYISGLLIFSSVLFHLYIIYRTLSQRESPLRGLDPSVKAFVLSLLLLLFSLMVGALSAGSENFSLIRLHSDILLYGFFPVLTIGASYHIIPFTLWWKKFAPMMGKEEIPTLKELFPEVHLERVLLLLLLSLAGMVGSIFLREFVQHAFTLVYAFSILYFTFFSFKLAYRFLFA